MSIQTANTWLLNEFYKFYLKDTLNVIIDSINKDNFVETLSDFVTANKTYTDGSYYRYFICDRTNSRFYRLTVYNALVNGQ